MPIPICLQIQNQKQFKHNDFTVISSTLLLLASLLLLFVSDFSVMPAVAGLPSVAKLVGDIPASATTSVDPAVADFIAAVIIP
jgi:hypothetical protein